MIGLEPEVQRLIQKQKRDIIAQRTAQDLAWSAIRTKLSGKLFDQQVALRETMSRVTHSAISMKTFALVNP